MHLQSPSCLLPPSTQHSFNFFTDLIELKKVRSKNVIALTWVTHIHPLDLPEQIIDLINLSHTPIHLALDMGVELGHHLGDPVIRLVSLRTDRLDGHCVGFLKILKVEN